MTAYYSSSTLQFEHSSLMAYILSQHQEDRILKGTIGIITKYGGKLIRETYNRAVSYYKDKRLKADIWLTTAHSSKGLTFGTVEVGEDLNLAVLDVLKKPKSERTYLDKETLMIGYVTVTRARHHLVNCKFL